MTTVDVCVATFRRPLLLSRLLEALRTQKLPSGVVMRVVVVDNDPAEAARGVVAAAQAAGCPVEYYTQPLQNIALTRNVAVAHSQAEWLAFIDDDELPQPDWLACLLGAQRTYQADVVIAPVHGELEADAPDWVRKGRFFDAEQRRSGAVVERGATGNALVHAALIADRLRAFDPQYGLTGGEDTDFFERLKRERGARMVWSQEALVRESVPTERATARWLLRRDFRGGQRFADIVGRPPPGWRRSLWFFKRLGLLLVASVLTLLSLPLGPARVMRWARKVASNLGQLSALTSYRYQEYRGTSVSR